MFILDSNRFGRDPDTVSNQIPVMIEKLGGEMLVSRLWEERRLAYPIKGQQRHVLAHLPAEDATTLARREIARLGGDLVGQVIEGPRNKLSKRHQVDLVVAGHGYAGWRNQARRN